MNLKTSACDGTVEILKDNRAAPANADLRVSNWDDSKIPAAKVARSIRYWPTIGRSHGINPAGRGLRPRGLVRQVEIEPPLARNKQQTLTIRLLRT